MVMERAGFASKLKQTLAVTPRLLVTADDIITVLKPLEEATSVGGLFHF
jgi:hypothetical protein